VFVSWAVVLPSDRDGLDLILIFYGDAFWMFRLHRDGNGSGSGRVEQLPTRQKGAVARNSYTYPYPRVEICTRTRWVLGRYRVPVGFIIPHVKTISK
jgi:hypothetical protein